MREGEDRKLALAAFRERNLGDGKDNDWEERGGAGRD